LLTTVWYEPIVLNRMIFHEKNIKYYLVQIKYFICSVLAYLLVYFITITLEPSLFTIIIKGILSFICVILAFTIFNFKTESYQYWLIKINGILKRGI
jgi:hypothetical protein